MEKSAPSSLQEQREAEQNYKNDLSSLSRVSHRLAMVDTTEKLSQVLNKLLPRLLMRIGENNRQRQQHEATSDTSNVLSKIHAKLVEMLSHTMKRVRDDQRCQLPCRGILNLLLVQDRNGTLVTKQPVDPFTLNLSLAFLTLGIPRCSVDDLEELLPGLLLLHGHFSSLSPDKLIQSPSTKLQWHQVTHLLFRTMESIMMKEENSQSSSNTKSNTTPSTFLNSTSSNKRLKSSSSSEEPSDQGNKTEKATANEEEDPITLARKLLARDETTASACYDLVLDLLLYQTTPTNSNVPPPGMSEASHVRLKGGASETARNFAAEMAPRSRLVQMKHVMLDWISPSRRWGIFMDTSSTNSTTSILSKGKTRTLALLMTAAGDPTPEVSERALTYLKQYLDAHRDVDDLYGDPAALILELLTLCVGASNAQLVLQKYTTKIIGSVPFSLGVTQHVDPLQQEPYTNTGSQQAALSLKRRMVGESTFATLVDYAAKILEEVPRLFSQENGDSSSTSSLGAIGSLAILACTKRLSQLRTASGLSMIRAKPYIAAGQLLGAFVVRLSTVKNRDETVLTLLAKSMNITCTVLSTILASRRSNALTNSSTSSTSSEGNAAVRDALYVAICVMARCGGRLSQENSTWLFSQGDSSASTLKIETATLLFHCVATEDEILRPRAVAALDALLASYCRLLSFDKGWGLNATKAEHMEVAAKPTSILDNPWSQGTSSAMEVDSRDPNFGLAYELRQLLLPLLWTAAQHLQPSQSRVSSARWASDLLSTLDLTSACHILCFLAGDSDVTASSLARDALGCGDGTSNKEEHAAKPLAVFSDMISLIFTDTNVPRGGSWRPSFWDFTPKGKSTTVEYLLQCLLHDIYGGDEEATQVFLVALSTSIIDASQHTRRDFLGLLDECSAALSLCLSTSTFARSVILSGSAPLNAKSIQELSLRCPSSKARRLLSECWGHLYNDAALHENSVWVSTIQIALQSCCNIVEGHSSVGEKHGAAFLGGTCIKLCREHPSQCMTNSISDIASRMLGLLGDGVVDSDDILGNAFTDGISIACSHSHDDVPILEDALLSGASLSLTSISQAIRKFGNGDSIDVPRISKLVRSAGMCLAATTVSRTHDVALGDSRLSCVEALFILLGSASFRKEEEVALWVGEALAEYCDAYSPENVGWQTETRDWPEEDNDEFARALPPHQQVLYKLLRKSKYESNPQKRTACAPALFAVVARGAKIANLDRKKAHRSLVKELSSRLQEIQECFLKLLGDPKSRHLSRESCCLGLASCRSIAILSSQSLTQDMNARLLKAFGQTTVHGGSAMQETPEQAAERRIAEGQGNEAAPDNVDMPDAEVGGASGIAEASLGAYREMARAAISLGRPDILYTLLILSVSNPAWTADGRDYGPSALLGPETFSGSQSTAEMRVALKSHLGKLIPRILRGCHSPNREAREQMQNLWNGLTGGGAEARAVITEHLKLTIDTLIEDSTSKLWRTRLGACSALAQVIVGRSWQDLGGGEPILYDDEIFTKSGTDVTTAGVRLLRIWRVAMRALDDVRSNVRESGETLGRSVRGLTLRLVDPNALSSSDSSIQDAKAHEKAASAAAATSLRWIIKHGLNQQCAEAAGVCISCLIGIIDVANPAILQPLVPDVLRSLLLSLSSLEPAAFNYLSVRAAGHQDRGAESYDTLERLRLQVVQSGPMAKAVTKILDMIPHMELRMQKAVVPELDLAIRQSTGLTTRTTAADCVSTLCSSCPEAFRSYGTSSTNNPSVSLLRALYWASERERGQAAREKYAHACGNLAALCPGPSVRSLALKAAEKYNRSIGNNDDPAARKAAAITLRAIAVKASNHFADGGQSDVWCRRILPVAFLGVRDPDPKISSLFADVWEEGGSAANLAGATDGFGTMLEEKLITYLVKGCVDALADVAWSRRVTGAEALQELAKKEILAPAPRRLNSDHSNGNLEESLRAQRRSEASQVAVSALTKSIANTRMWSGKLTIIDAFCAVVSKWSSKLARADDASEVTGTKIATSSPIHFRDQADTESLFVGDGRFKKELDHELPDEMVQTTDEIKMDSHTSQPESSLDFSGDMVNEESNVDFTIPERLSEDVVTTDGETAVPNFVGICRMLLVQSFPSKQSCLSVKEEEILPYRAASMKALASLLKSIDESTRGSQQKKIVYGFVIESLVPLIEGSLQEYHDDIQTTEGSPLLVSRALDCLAACFWDGFGIPGETYLDIKYSKTYELMKVFEALSIVERPWTIKTSALHASADLVVKAHPTSLQDYATVSTAVRCAALALKDRKFWKVRHAGLSTLNMLVSRCGQAQSDNYQANDTKNKERQRILETVLPLKETILKLVKTTLRDSEAKVTALAGHILSSIAWWP